MIGDRIPMSRSSQMLSIGRNLSLTAEHARHQQFRSAHHHLEGTIGGESRLAGAIGEFVPPPSVWPRRRNVSPSHRLVTRCWRGCRQRVIRPRRSGAVKPKDGPVWTT